MTLAVDSRSRFLLLLDEQASSILPSDATGKLADPTIPAGVARPPVVSGTITGFGRDFVRASSHGLLYDDAADALKLTRPMGIIALLRLDLASLSNGQLCTIVQRGRGGGSDPIAFALHVHVDDVAQRLVHVQLAWQTEAGVDVGTGSVFFTWPDGEYLFLGATREVVDGQVEVRYAVNGEQDTDPTTLLLDVGAIASADVSVGMGMSGASYVNHLDGVLDYLEVVDEAISPEEFAWIWDRISVAEREGVATMRSLVPPGVYSRDPSSRIQRELQVEGQALGLVKGLARRVHRYNWPDVAWGEALEGWEALTGHSPKPGDWTQRRRDRVAAFMATKRGFALEDIKEQLVEAFDVPNTGHVFITEYSNQITEPFDGGDPPNGATPSHRAKVIAGSGTWRSDVSAVANSAQRYDATSLDLRYRHRRDGAERAGLYLYSLGHGDLASVMTAPSGGVPSNGVLVGVVMGSMVTDEWLFAGNCRDAGSAKAGYFKAMAGSVDSAFTITNASPSSLAFIFLHHEGGGVYRLRYGSSQSAALATAGDLITGGPTAPLWAGIAVAAPSGAGSSLSVQADFSTVIYKSIKGPERLHWNAWRNPATAGSPDMEGARLIVSRLTPAHVEASAALYRNVLCDDAMTCDREPIGV